MASKYTKEILQEAVTNSESVAGVLKYLGLRWAGGTHAHISNKIKEFELDTSHFRGRAWNKGKQSPTRLDWQDVLVHDRHDGRKQHTYMLRRAMLDYGFEDKCSNCSQGPEWCGLSLTIEVDHIDGNNLNDVPDNLRFLCPNCHSQQSTSNRPHKYR